MKINKSEYKTRNNIYTLIDLYIDDIGEFKYIVQTDKLETIICKVDDFNWGLEKACKFNHINIKII